jgi:CheY-like chemotaxis protein
MIEPQAQRRGIGMTFPRFDVPCWVHADRTRLKQVVINLLSNAIKYNAVGGTVVVACCGDTPGRVRISVTDTGNGLSSEQMGQLFQPFNRLGQESNAEQGTGIGLVVSKRLIELMDGVIGVESEIGIGSIFWIELHSTTEMPAVKSDESEVASPLRAGAALRTLLYVEDNPANLRLVERLIARRPDIRLMTAIDGMIGVNLARSAKPEVILMDINLPGISGIEALKLLRSDPATAHIPVVAVSANAIPRDVQKGIEAGFFRYLTKPIKVAEFMDTLSAALDFVDKGAGAN